MMTEHLRTIRYYAGKTGLVLSAAAIGLAATLSLFGHFYGSWWRFAYYSNPRPVFAIFALAAGVGFAIRRHMTLTVIAATTLILNTLILVPILQPASQKGATEGSFTVAHINSDKGKAEIDQVANKSPDLLFIQEVTAQTEQAIAGLTDYTLVENVPSEDTRGSAVLISNQAEIEVAETETVQTADSDGRTMIVVYVEVGERTVAILSAHTTRPNTNKRNQTQLDEFQFLAQWSRSTLAADNDVVIVGDLNATPWSPRVKRLLDEGDLAESIHGGLQGSWPSSLPFLFRLPIDGAVHSKGLDAWDRETFTVTGGDHLALAFTVVLRP